MNILLEKQVREYFGKGLADITDEIAGLLDIISRTDMAPLNTTIEK
jgi:hypothetical protein